MAKASTADTSGETERARHIDRAIADIEKQYGKGAIMRLGEAPREKIPVISTGSLGLNLALGVGGVPRGRIIEIYGPESSGKTTLTLHIAAEAQKAGGVAAFIDAEHALDVAYAEKLGINIDELLVAQPDTGEQALDIAETLIRSGAVDLVVIDSVAALVPKAEIDGEIGDSHVGLQARLMSQAMRKLTGTLSKTMCCAVFINQIREKIGVMFGNPETTPGGRALKFYASVRIDIRRIGSIKHKGEDIGNLTRAKVVKNKLCPPFKTAEFEILFGQGISRQGEVLDIGEKMRVLERSGTWYTFGGERLGQGKENARRFLLDNPDIMKQIEDRIYAEFEAHGAPGLAPRAAGNGSAADEA